MKKHLYYIVYFLFSLIFIVSCTQEIDADIVKDTSVANPDTNGGNDIQLSDQALITEFTISYINNIGFETKPISNVIDQKTKIITVVFPSKTPINSLTPVIKISEKATISDAGGVPKDFTKLVTYKVTAEDGTIEKYAVNVSNLGVISKPKL